MNHPSVFANPRLSSTYLKRPPLRPFQRLLVANRGEIAVRILSSARELDPPIITYALYTDGDTSHIPLGRPHHALKLPSPASYTDVGQLVQLIKENGIDAVHPGYGFLSESAEFARQVWEEAGAAVIGPGWGVLERTGDKLKAKALAEECGVPVLPAMKTPTNDPEVVRQFAVEVGLPIMVKAVDGGGGRGIRLVNTMEELPNAVRRAVGESPSRTVFAEKAAVNGFNHVEVQIIGDHFWCTHVWDRDCSVQRRYQKIVEVATSPNHKRKVIHQAIEDALKMAEKLHFIGLGTWEFLINASTKEYYFMEINPRLQVEHTITETTGGYDLILAQLIVAQGRRFSELEIRGKLPDASPRPYHAVQLRICAEDPSANFALSIGKITDFHMPCGNGIRVDSHVTSTSNTTIGSDFDNLVAKLIVTGYPWKKTVQKAKRALEDVKIGGIKTNLDLLRGIVASEDFEKWSIDTSWLERTLPQTLALGKQITASIETGASSFSDPASTQTQAAGMLASSILFRKGDAWTLALEPVGDKSKGEQQPHHLVVDRVLRNEFPTSITAEITYTIPGDAGEQPPSQAYRMTMTSTTTTADALTSAHRRAEKNNKNHIAIPMSGKLVEVLVMEGDWIEENQVIAFVKQMKMELEVRSPRAGRVKWAFEMENEDGEDVAEGVLLAELEEEREKAQVEVRAKM